MLPVSLSTGNLFLNTEYDVKIIKYNMYKIIYINICM